LPLAQRAQLRRHAHWIVRSDGQLAFAEIWHCLLLDHVLELRHESVLREAHALSLPECAPAIATLTDLLATHCCAGQADLAGARVHWRAEMAKSLGLDGFPAPEAAQASPGIARAVHRLARLSWMLRPQLMKAWCALALRQRGSSAQAPQELADALRTSCILIDTPMPPALQERYPQRDQRGA
jgi:hypothetical protein